MATSKKTMLAGVFGNALEWYDFTAYAFLAPILAEIFFPAHDPFISLLMTFSVFALGFLARPFGALLFGYLGDSLGRRKALIISIIVMSLPTFLLGLLPTYATIGIMAPILLTILRLLQGTAVSGELTSAAAYLVEHAGENRRGWAGSLVMCSAFVGITLSSAMITLFTETTTHEHLLSWGWRLPFLLGGIIGLAGLIIRLRSAETHLFEQSKILESGETSTTVFAHLTGILRHKAVWLAMLLTCIMAVGNWFFIAYFNTFLTKQVNLPIREVMLINFIILCLFTLLLPLLGMLSDNVGRKPVLKIGIIGFILLSYPIFWLLNHGSIITAFAGELLFAVILAFIVAVIPTALAELFQVRTRNSGMALGYNFSLALFGGTAPLIALALVARTGNHFAPAYYLILCALVSLVALNRLKESFREELI
jgi:proline/betaine transport protein TphA